MSAIQIEGMIRRTANLLGMDIHRHRLETSQTGRLSTMLARQAVDVVFDVGANTGQFARTLREAGYRDQMVSFEPLSTAHARLLRASQRDERWTVAPRMALGDNDGEIEMHVAGNSVSSSALQMLDSHANAAPESAYVNSERVRLSRLDSVAHDYLKPGSVPFLKIDSQGYEDRVLDGAPDLLSRVRGLQLELSLVPLYEGQQLFDVLVARARASGFSIWGIWPGFFDSTSGRMLQVDAIFFRD